MSTYLEIKLKRKNQPVDLAPYVLSLATTEARELADGVNFVWNAENKDDDYKYWTVLSKDLINDILSFYKDKIERMKEVLSNTREEIDSKTKLLPLCNKEIFDLVEERIDQAKETQTWAQEELEIASYRLYDFNHLESLLVENKDFELVYYIG